MCNFLSLSNKFATIFWRLGCFCREKETQNFRIQKLDGIWKTFTFVLYVKLHIDPFFTALASFWSNIFTNSNEKKTCLLLSLLCIFKFQTLTCQNFWIFYFTSRLTLYECAVNVYIQRQFLIRHWTIFGKIMLKPL